MMETITIPVADGVNLEGRVYTYASSRAGSPPPVGLAIIAHPYGSLGGSFDDYVVCAISELLATKRHFEVVTYNSRGVGKSSGRASWTGASESEDYERVTRWAMRRFEERHALARGAALVLIGYSAGSMYCSMAKVDHGELRSKATWSSPARYILVSYPRGMQWALSLFSSRRYDGALEALLRQPDAGGDVDGPAEVLIIYGTNDEFTSAKTYTSWTSKLVQSSPSAERSLTVKCIDEADHFWHSQSSLRRLTETVDSWIPDKLPDKRAQPTSAH